jgi:hypothetical protein
MFVIWVSLSDCNNRSSIAGVEAVIRILVIRMANWENGNKLQKNWGTAQFFSDSLKYYINTYRRNYTIFNHWAEN